MEGIMGKNSKTKENFILFSLDPVLDDSELNLAYTSSLPLVVEPSKFKLAINLIVHFVTKFHNFAKSLKTDHQ